MTVILPIKVRFGQHVNIVGIEEFVLVSSNCWMLSYFPTTLSMRGDTSCVCWWRVISCHYYRVSSTMVWDGFVLAMARAMKMTGAGCRNRMLTIYRRNEDGTRECIIVHRHRHRTEVLLPYLLLQPTKRTRVRYGTKHQERSVQSWTFIKIHHQE